MDEAGESQYKEKMIVNKNVFDSIPPMMAAMEEGHHIDSSEAQQPNEKSSSSDGSSNSQSDELMKPVQIYRNNVDISGVPRFFFSFVDGDGFYEFPNNDIEVLDWCCKPLPLHLRAGRFGNSDPTEIYHVKVEAESCSVKECLELLNGIGRFITCSAEKANLFFAALNKDGAARLKGSNGIQDVIRRGDLVFQH